MREAWLRQAVDELRAHFQRSGFDLPKNIRLAIGFTSTGRRSRRKGECWHHEKSDDGHYEIFIRADLADPVQVLLVLVKELVHTLLPPDTKHGKAFRDASFCR